MFSGHILCLFVADRQLQAGVSGVQAQEEGVPRVEGVPKTNHGKAGGGREVDT